LKFIRPVSKAQWLDWMLRRKGVQRVISVMIVIMQDSSPVQFIALNLRYAVAGSVY